VIVFSCLFIILNIILPFKNKNNGSVFLTNLTTKNIFISTHSF
jgi:hypothetical protein